MTVRAKFKVYSITRHMGSTGKYNEEGRYVSQPTEMWTIEMNPVFPGENPEHENSKFWAASPGGSIKLNCVNRTAVEQFDIEKEFYVDFTPA